MTSDATASGVTVAPLPQVARTIAVEVAGLWADEVDRDARFPVETIDAVRRAGLLGAMIPVELGGLGADLDDISSVATELAQHCASSAMIFAMHQIQVACLIRHGRNDTLRAFLRRVATEGLLLASATTEIGRGGDARTSTCAVQVEGDRFRLTKHAPVISYGRYADAILVTARRGPDSPPSDQSLVLCESSSLTLEDRSVWNSLGFRGTCSPGFLLDAQGGLEQLFDDPYEEISSRTMLPVSHLLWSAIWSGLGYAAADRARRFVQQQAHRTPGVMPQGALRLAELHVTLQQLVESTTGLRRRYAELTDENATSMGTAVAMNTLKVSASSLVIEIVGRAMTICGLAGYQLDSPFSLGRLLRDAHGGAVMVNNDRILHNNAQLLLALKEWR